MSSISGKPSSTPVVSSIDSHWGPASSSYSNVSPSGSCASTVAVYGELSIASGSESVEISGGLLRTTTVIITVLSASNSKESVTETCTLTFPSSSAPGVPYNRPESESTVSHGGPDRSMNECVSGTSESVISRNASYGSPAMACGRISVTITGAVGSGCGGKLTITARSNARSSVNPNESVTRTCTECVPTSPAAGVPDRTPSTEPSVIQAGPCASSNVCVSPGSESVTVIAVRYGLPAVASGSTVVSITGGACRSDGGSIPARTVSEYSTSIDRPSLSVTITVT